MQLQEPQQWRGDIPNYVGVIGKTITYKVEDGQLVTGEQPEASLILISPQSAQAQAAHMTVTARAGITDVSLFSDASTITLTTIICFRLQSAMTGQANSVKTSVGVRSRQ